MQNHIMILAKTAQQTTGVQNANQCDKQLACLIMSERNRSNTLNVFAAELRNRVTIT